MVIPELFIIVVWLSFVRLEWAIEICQIRPRTLWFALLSIIYSLFLIILKMTNSSNDVEKIKVGSLLTETSLL